MQSSARSLPLSSGAELSDPSGRLAPARPDQIRQITSESHRLWGGGLTHEAYFAMWEELEQTPWARLHYSHCAWTDASDRLLSSVKVYRPLVRLHDRTGRGTAIGAVFTPSDRRGEGHAAAMMRAVVEESRSRGDLLAMLFSDIGIRFYDRLGFIPLPAEEASGILGSRADRPPAGISLRPMTDEDYGAIVEAHAEASRDRSLAIVRDLGHWSFLIRRARAFFRRFEDTGVSMVYQTATRDGRFAGYLVGLTGEEGWNLREAAAAEGDPDLLAAILRAGAAEARACGARRIHGWLPRELGELVPDWRLRFSPREMAIPMILPLESGVALPDVRSPLSVHLSALDHF